MVHQKNWVPNDLRAKDASPRFFGNVLERVKNWTISGLSKIFPPIEADIEGMKEEIWAELSCIYYKYEDEAQKRAFREVICDISERIGEGDWGLIYKKLYRMRV